jgi:two-component system, chemotaxis family, response regulator Rcp1
VRPPIEQSPILIIEDNPGDVLLVRESLKFHGLHGDLMVARTGEDALRIIDGIESNPKAACPRLVILDLNLPRKNGFDVLTAIRKSRRCGAVPVMILSTSDSMVDREKSIAMGATKYLSKPANLQDLMSIGGVIKAMIEGARD